MPDQDQHKLPLFRQEIINAKTNDLFGTVRIANANSAWIFVIIALTVGLLLLLFISIGSYTKKSRVSGILVPTMGSISIIAPNGGVLIENRVSEGEHVVRGQTIFELSTEKTTGNGELSGLINQQISARADSLALEKKIRVAQYDEKKSALAQKLASEELELNQLDREIEVVQRRVTLSEQSYQKYQNLQASGYFSSMQTQQKNEELLDVQSRLANLQRAKIQASAATQQTRSEIVTASTSYATDLARFDQTAAQLQQESIENGSRKSVLITAPGNGTITTITYNVGQSINGGQTLATFIPENAGPNKDDLEIHLFVPTKSAGFIVGGSEVLIRYHAFPYQKFGLYKGLIKDVSRTPFGPSELPANLASIILTQSQQASGTTSSNELLYRVKIRPDILTINAYGKDVPLKPGMTLDADVIQDKRKIWEWIADPLLAIAHR